MSLVLLPLTFLSTAPMQQTLIPELDPHGGEIQPGELGREAGRSAAMQHIDWGLVGSRVGLLAALALACAWFATHAFTSYQRSL